MADPGARELKLIQYLNEAYGKEKQLETVLQAQIGIAQKPTIKKRLQEHYKETKAQAKGLEKRIKALGGKASTSSIPGPDAVGEAALSVANKAMAAAKGPVQALRGTSVADNNLRNMRDAYWNEAEEIAHYNVIEAAADQLGDKETVKLAKEFRRQEERMQKFIEKQIPGLMRAVIQEEVPAKERKPGSASSSRSSARRSSSSRSSSSARKSTGGSSRSSARKSSGAASTRKSSGSGSTSRSTSRSSGSTSRSASGGSSTRKSSGGASTRKSSGSSTRKSSGSTTRKSSGSSRSGGSGSGSSSS